MSDITTLATSDTLSASRTTLNNNIAYLQAHFASATAPASPVTGQFWIDTTTATEILKVYDGAAWRTIMADVFSTAGGGGLLPLSGGTMTGNVAFASTYKLTGLASGTASGDSITKGQVDARVHVATCYVGTLSASDNKYLVIVGTGTWTIVDVVIVSELAVTSDASNLWTFQVRNLTASLDLRSAVKSTNGAAITADTAYALGLDQNLSPASAAVLQLQCAKTGAPNNLQECLAIVRYTITT